MASTKTTTNPSADKILFLPGIAKHRTLKTITERERLESVLFPFVSLVLNAFRLRCRDADTVGWAVHHEYPEDLSSLPMTHAWLKPAICNGVSGNTIRTEMLLRYAE